MRPTRTLLVAILASGITTVTTFAAETERLPDLVITPMRFPTPTDEVPYANHLIPGSGTSDAQPRTTPDALKGLPSVMVQKTSYGQGSPFLRGFTGFRTLMLIEGIRLNNSTFRDGPNQYWNTVDPWSVRQYELVMGPASVLYGSDAIGGSVNALTLAPPSWSGEPAYEGNLIYRGATADESHQIRGQFGARVDEHLGLVGGYSFKQFDDLEGGKDVGTQEKTGYDENAYDARADYSFDSGATLTLGHQNVAQDDAWRTHRTIYGISWEGLAKGDDLVHTFDQDRTLTYLRLAQDDLAEGFIDAYRLTLSRHDQQEDQERVRANERRDLNGFDVTTWGAQLEMETLAPVGRLVYGAEYYRDSVDSYGLRYNADGSFRSREIQGPVADDATYDLVGVFVQDTLTATDAGLELTPGARYTYAALDANRVADRVSGEVTSRDDDWDNLSASLRARQPFGPDRRDHVYAGVSQGFRAPNLSDLTRLDSARSSEIETPVDNLDPEEFVSLELGVRLEGERARAGAAWYYTWIDGMIVRTPTGRVIDDLNEVTKKNAGDGFVQGVELTAAYDLATDWTLRFAGTWMDGEVDAFPTSSPEKQRESISRVMPLTGQLALRWTPLDTAWAEFVIDAADKADQLSADDRRDTQRIPPGGTPGYAVYTLRGGYALTPAIDLTLALENLADEDYRIHGSGVNEPGRQLVCTVNARF